MLGGDHSIVNSVLFDFDSLVDYKVGIVQTMKMNMKGASGINTWYLNHSTTNDFKLDRIYSIEDIVYKALDENKRDSYQEFTDYILSSDYEADCYRYSVPTSLSLLLSAYLKSNIIKVEILCKNEIQKKFIESILPKTSGHTIIGDRSDAVLDKYGVIYLGYLKHLLELPEFRLKHFTVPGFRENFEDENSELMKYIIPFTDLNKFSFVEPYIKVNLPNG